MAGKRYKHPDTLKDRRPQRVKPPAVLLATVDDIAAAGNIPTPPTGLLKATRDFWAEVWASPLAPMLIKTDHFRLDRYFRYVDEWIRVTRDLARARRDYEAGDILEIVDGEGSPTVLVHRKDAVAVRAVRVYDPVQARDWLGFTPAMLEHVRALPGGVVFYSTGIFPGGKRNVLVEYHAAGNIPEYYRVAKPIAARRRDAEQACQRAEEAFGFTPLARMRLNIALGEAGDALARFQDGLAGPGDDDAGEEVFDDE